jgi:predicted metal-binding protein
MKEKETHAGPEDLIELARRLGASNAGIISSAGISVEDDLANLCQESLCENYGQSASCPPHVSGPSGFRELLKEYEQVLVFKIDVPSEVLFSSERPNIFRLLHEIGANIEQSAVRMGYRNSKAYAGGSCKRLFCPDHPKCRVVSEGGKCRNPDRARPSMSGFGINVSKLMLAAGWTMHRSTPPGVGPGAASTGTVCGLVLIG